MLISSVSTAGAQDPAEKVTFLDGDAWVQEGLARSPLESGSIVYTGEQIRTGAESNVYLRFLDQTPFALGPEASMNIDTYDEREDAETSFATGIRGTNVAGEVFERRETETGVIEASASVMLLEDEKGEDTAIEASNQYGSAVIDEPGLGTGIPDQGSPPSPVRRMQIRTVDNLLRAIRNPTRSSTQRRRP